MLSNFYIKYKKNFYPNTIAQSFQIVLKPVQGFSLLWNPVTGKISVL